MANHELDPDLDPASAGRERPRRAGGLVVAPGILALLALLAAIIVREVAPVAGTAVRSLAAPGGGGRSDSPRAETAGRDAGSADLGSLAQAPAQPPPPPAAPPRLVAQRREPPPEPVTLIEAALTVEPSGAISRALLASTVGVGDTLERCLIRKARAWRFNPDSRRRTQDVLLPFVLVPGET